MLKREVKLTYPKQEWVHLKDKEACSKRQRLKTHGGKGSDVLNIPLSCQKDIIVQQRLTDERNTGM